MAESRPESTGDSADHVLAEYLRRVDQGEAVDRERFIAEHPEAAEPLREYFAGSDAIRGVVDDAAARVKPGDPAQATLSPDVANPVTHAQSLFTTETTGYPVQSSDEVGATRSLSTAGEPVGVAQVAAFLASSGLMTPEAVDELLSRASGEDDSAEATRLLDELQSSGRLTPFQCQAIREGRTAELVLGNYVVLDRLGRGGMGQVFRAWHRKMDRVVALKTLRPETMNSDKAVRRFHREVKTAARLAHPNIVTAYDADESGGVHFLVMEHVAGSDLARRVREHGPARFSQAANWIMQAARGLNHAHLHGIIHRDIKPGNLLLANDGTVKVLDMGLARLEARLGGEGAAVDALTQNGDVLGTLDYMAPEQAEDTAQADARADIYSLGCTLFYLLTGRAVYGGHTAVKKLLAHREAPVPSLAEARRDVPEQIDALFQRMVAKNPANRPTSMAEVIAELEPFATAASAAKEETQTYCGPLPQTAGTPISRSGQRIAVAVGVASAVILALCAGMAILWMPSPDGPPVANQDHPQVTVEVVESDGLDRAAATEHGWAGWPKDTPAPAVAPFDAAQARKHQEEWAEYLGVPLEFTNSIDMRFVLIPPGEFMMGSTEEEVEQLLQEANELKLDQWEIDWLSSEAPRHRVRITRPFYLGLYEVTQAEYQRVTGSNPSAWSVEGKETARVADLDTSRHPVEMVSWYDAKVFCEKLSAMPDEQTAGRVYVLPTEAQWEYACRAGTTTRWSCGDDEGVLKDYAWYSVNAGGTTRGVGEKKPNGFGLFDMHGNVREWCADWGAATYYAESPVDDPQGPASGSYRLFRGGSWRSFAWRCPSANRNRTKPDHRENNLGFRVACEIPPKAEIARRQTEGQRAKTNNHLSTTRPSLATPEELPPGAPPPAIAPFDAATARKHQEAWAAHLGEPLQIENSIGMKFVLIPPGEFMMGSTEEEVVQLQKKAKERREPPWYLDGLPWEAFRHQVRITRPVYLGLHEVTQGEYEQVMGVNPSHFSGDGKGSDNVVGLDTSRHPVEMVSWSDTKAFCQKLSTIPEEQTARRVYVLPTEAQWEYACRAGTTTKWGYGDDVGVLGDYAWFDTNSGLRTHPVGNRKPNAYGLFDMHGNVWEWCADWYVADYYAASPVDDPQGPASGLYRVLRGGAWGGPAWYCRSAGRNRRELDYRSDYLGFRVALVRADESGK